MASDTPRDLKLGADGDLVVADGDLALVRGGDAIAQAVRIALQFFRGEWFADLGAGIPYFQNVLVKSPDAGALDSVFRSAIKGVLGVLEVTSLSLALDRAARTLAVTFSASTDAGLLGPLTVEVSP